MEGRQRTLLERLAALTHAKQDARDRGAADEVAQIARRIADIREELEAIRKRTPVGKAV